jgi:hypothetical protein
MKRIALWAVLGLALAGCIVPSVYPFYTEKDLVFEAALLGAWHPATGDDPEKETWTFAKDGDTAYLFTMVKDTETNLFSAHLFKLKEHLFMDCLFLRDDDTTGIPPHYLLKVEQLRPILKLTTLDYKWVADYLEKNPGAIRHTLALDKPGDPGTHVVLTADTKDLQKFVLKHLDDPKVFVDAGEMQPVETK